PHPDGTPMDISAPVDGEFRKAMDLFGWELD
ncbi:pseudouridylate synthase, partial [Mycobacterium tuberculosis]